MKSEYEQLAIERERVANRTARRYARRMFCNRLVAWTCLILLSWLLASAIVVGIIALIDGV